MESGTFSTPIDKRYFEDYVPGTRYEFGEIGVSQAEIVDFAQRFDPQVFHVDPEGAQATPFGGLIASGWHTGSLMMRLIADHYLSSVASLASPGVDELRWLRPVRPGDRLRVRILVVDAHRSRTKPDRGMVRSSVEVVNQQGETVMSMILMNFLRCRNV
ncbi:MAG: MaoC family dehydratase [Betaproteobacteria bacterium]